MCLVGICEHGSKSTDEEDNTQQLCAPRPLFFFFVYPVLSILHIRNIAEKVLCNTTGWSLVFHKPDSRFHQPAFSLLACHTTMTAALVVRGTGSIQDVITDIQAMPVPFPSPIGDAGSGETFCENGL